MGKRQTSRRTRLVVIRARTGGKGEWLGMGTGHPSEVMEMIIVMAAHLIA
jgi:hypothetical protein